MTARTPQSSTDPHRDLRERKRAAGTLAQQFVRRYNATPRGDFDGQNDAAAWAAARGDQEEGEHGGCVTTFPDGSISFHDWRTQRAEVLE